MAMDAYAGQAIKAPDVMPQQTESEPVKDVDCGGLSFMQTFQSPAAGNDGALKDVRSASGYEQSPAGNWETGAANQFELVGANSKELSYAAASGKNESGGAKREAGGNSDSSGKRDTSGKNDSALEKNRLGLSGLGMLLLKIL